MKEYIFTEEKDIAIGNKIINSVGMVTIFKYKNYYKIVIDCIVMSYGKVDRVPLRLRQVPIGTKLGLIMTAPAQHSYP